MKKRWMSLISLGLAVILTSQTVLAANVSSGSAVNNGVQREQSAAESTPEAEVTPTAEPTPEAEVAPTAEPTPEAEVTPTAEPTPEAEVTPTVEPTPSEKPTPDPEEDVELKDEERASSQIEKLTISSQNGLGSTITLTPELKKDAVAVEDGKSKYRYIYHRDGDDNWYEIISDSTKLEEAEWKPTQKGVYLIALQVTDADGEVVNFFSSRQVIAPSIKVNGVKTSEKAGETYSIQITPEYTTNVSKDDLSFTYQIYDLDKKAWHNLAVDVKESSVDWKPAKAGDYWIYVTMKNSKGAEGSLCVGYNVQSAKVTGLAIEEGKQVQFYKEPITFKGSVSNPTNQKLTYEYLFYDGAYWNRLALDEKLKSYEFTAKKPGNYLICFQAYDIENKLIGQSFMGYEAQKPSATVTSIKPMAVEEKVLELELESKTNDPETEFRWMYYDLKNKVWGNIQDWSKEKTATWNVSAFGTYWIHAEARTSDGEVTAMTIGHEVKPYYVKMGNMQVYTPDYATYYIQQGVETNDPKLKYKYMIYDLRTKQWSTLPSGMVNTYWQPKVSGSYWIHAEITDSKGKTYTNTIAWGIQGYKIANFGFSSNLEAGVAADLSLTGNNYLHEDYTFKYLQWNGAGWDVLYKGKTPKTIKWTPPVEGYFAFCGQVINQNGDVVDERTINISPSNFKKNGWYYENGYKFYYINGVKQLDLDNIIGFQSSYVAKINRKTCTVTIYASDGANGYIIPVKRFACSVGLPATPTPLGTFNTIEKMRWGMLMGPSWGQYCTRIVGGILFHSVAGSTKSIYNLNPANYNMLGYPASHGCVRLCVKDAKWIYDHCKLGMQVTIYDSPDPGPLGRGPVYRITNPNQNWDPTDPEVNR